jgi:hypothetical protein
LTENPPFFKTGLAKFLRRPQYLRVGKNGEIILLFLAKNQLKRAISPIFGRTTPDDLDCVVKNQIISQFRRLPSFDSLPMSLDIVLSVFSVSFLSVVEYAQVTVYYAPIYRWLHIAKILLAPYPGKYRGHDFEGLR